MNLRTYPTLGVGDLHRWYLEAYNQLSDNGCASKRGSLHPTTCRISWHGYAGSRRATRAVSFVTVYHPFRRECGQSTPPTLVSSRTSVNLASLAFSELLPAQLIYRSESPLPECLNGDAQGMFLASHVR